MMSYIYNFLLFHHVKLDRLHDQDFYLLIVYTIFVLQFLILVDRHSLFYYGMWLNFVYSHDYDDELFLSMYVIHLLVFVNVRMLLHDRQVNENLARDNHFDSKNAMDHVVMMRIWRRRKRKDRKEIWFEIMNNLCNDALRGRESERGFGAS